MGPTASGKTALGCALAEKFPLELISVDSALVYRGMDIGTAKPDAQTLTRYPHALIDIRDPEQAYSAAQFHDDAMAVMRQITTRGCVPLLVGGTGLYFRALQQGLSPLPMADPALRARLAAEAETVGWPGMHARLAARDPIAGARIKPNDAQRIQRALEVIALTGSALSELQGRASPQFPYRALKLALVPDRALLHQRIAQRFDSMLAAGFLDEVRQLRQRDGLLPDMPSMRAVGYRQAWQHLDGSTDAVDFRAAAIAATRQLAKRQTTWLRSSLDTRWLQGSKIEAVTTQAVADFLAAHR